MSKHTPGPWRLIPARFFGLSKVEDAEKDDVVIVPSHPRVEDAVGIALVYRDNIIDTANALRIVACVNACEGINPEAIPDLIEAADQAQCSCTVAERLSGHLLECWMPRLIEALNAVKAEAK